MSNRDTYDKPSDPNGLGVNPLGLKQKIMKPLHLTLKKQWFDMIASGEKKEEYRDIKMHWATRFCDGFPGTFGIDMNCQSFKDFQWINFTNGYRPDSRIMRCRCLGISIGEGRPEWGAEPGKKYFVIKIGDRV